MATSKGIVSNKAAKKFNVGGELICNIWWGIMSRIGKNPVNLPEGIKVKIEKDCTKVKGPNGELEVAIHSGISVSHTDNMLIVERSSDERKQRSVHGTIRQLLANAVTGVSE
jgi:large subunit ribosomal protein L6